jgi:hypothetical protein
MTAWQRGDARNVWELMSPRLKRGNSDSRKIKDLVEHRGIFPAEYSVRKVSISGKSADIIARIDFSDTEGHKVVEDENCRFIFLDSDWYFDECNPANLPAP